jgi:hypothetical protein
MTEGTPTESYLDTANRADFETAGLPPTVATNPSLTESIWWRLAVRKKAMSPYPEAAEARATVRPQPRSHRLTLTRTRINVTVTIRNAPLRYVTLGFDAESLIAIGSLWVSTKDCFKPYRSPLCWGAPAAITVR